MSANLDRTSLSDQVYFRTKFAAQLLIKCSIYIQIYIKIYENAGKSYTGIHKYLSDYVYFMFIMYFCTQL